MMAYRRELKAAARKDTAAKAAKCQQESDAQRQQRLDNMGYQ